MTRIGSLFSGIGGLDLAVERFTGGTTVWQCEFEKNPSAVLAEHWPDVPNLGDITQVDWSTVEPVDVLCGGFPCQDISQAGKGAGIVEGKTRSGLWFSYAEAIRVLRPRLVVVENVSALLRRGLDIVLGSLAEAGYDAEWSCIRAADAGAPHRRERVFIVAAHSSSEQSERRGVSGDVAGEGCHSQGEAQERQRGGDSAGNSDSAFTDAVRLGWDGRPRATGRGQEWRAPATRGGEVAWGKYESAIRRWECVTRPAPAPTNDRGSLSPAFVEWMMGFPEGWVSSLGRPAALKALGNAVVPQQALLALSTLL